MTNKSTIQPFATGDILVGVTLLNNADDDHAGDGRIIQYDKDLNEKGVLWTKGTSHLVGGLKFGPDGTLWAFDSHAHAVLKINQQGEQQEVSGFPDRSFSNVNFVPDGTVILGEHMVGNADSIKLPPDRPLGTTLPVMEGTDRFGDGHIFHCKADGELITEFDNKVHGGMPGFLGVCNTVLKPDGKTAVYLSELSDGVYQFDISSGKQLDDLISYAPDSGNMAMCIGYTPDGVLCHIKANFREGFFFQTLNDDGSVIREYPLPGPGWAALGNGTESGFMLIGNFFTGAVAKLKLESGEFVATAETGTARSVAGIAQVPA